MKEIKPPKPCSVLSIDVGKKRVGLAGCDPLGITVSQLPAIIRKSFTEDIKIFKQLCLHRNVKGLVIGLPLNNDGKPTQQARFCQLYGEKLAVELKLPMAWVNEHSSTWEAGMLYKLEGDRSGRLDSAAAALLLEQWLKEGPDLEPVNM